MTTVGQGEALGRVPVDAPPIPGARRRAALTPGRLRVAALLALVGPVCLAIVLRRDVWLLTSDSVAQQSIVRTWFAVGHDRTYLPPDTWLLKLPLYAVVEALPLAPAARVLLESLALAALTAALAGWAVRELAAQAGLPRRWSDVALVLGWLLTLSGGVGSYLVAMPNSRNVELGIALVVVAWTGRRLAAPGTHGWRPTPAAVVRGAGVGVLLSVAWVDDPYIADLVALPLAVAALAWFARPASRGGRDPRLLGVAAVLLGSFAVLPAVRRVLAAAGVTVVADATAPTFDPAQMLQHLSILPAAAAVELGLPEPGAAAGVAHVLAVVVGGLGVAAAVAVTVRGWRRGRLAVTFLGVHALAVVGGVVVDRTVYDSHAARYLVLAFVDLAGCLAIGLGLVRERRPRWVLPVTALVAAGLAANLVSAAVDHPVTPSTVALQRRDQQDVLAALRLAAHGGPLEVYGPFWTADLQTDLSDGAFQVVEVGCHGGRLRQRLWLTDTARQRVRVERSAVIVPSAAPELRGCSPETIGRQLAASAGPGSVHLMTTPGGTTIVVVDRDIAPLVPE